MKTPIMDIYLDNKNRENKDVAMKIASHIKYTIFKDIRDKVDIYYDPQPFEKDSIMNKDHVNKIFRNVKYSKTACTENINSLPWLMRVIINKDNMYNKNITLLDIKAEFCHYWDRRHKDSKTKEEKNILERITNIAVLSNSDNDPKPIIHIRFDVKDLDYNIVVDFLKVIVDNLRLKGIENIDKVYGPDHDIVINFNKDTGGIDKSKEYVIKTAGVNIERIRYLNGIDLNRTTCNDIVTVHKKFGIEAARMLLLKEVNNIFTKEFVNYQHIAILIDFMTKTGRLTSIDRHGLNKLDTDPLGRVTFERPVDQLLTAATFGEVDYMKSVSARIMSGLAINGGTGLCNVIVDTEFIENSEYIDEDIDVMEYDVAADALIGDIMGKTGSGMFIPN
jgi:DNA-directed RNA polymerase II subunit RPB1